MKWLTSAYGLVILTSGLYRYWCAGSQNALWFGVVMSVLAFTGSIFLFYGKTTIGLILELLTVIFVGGFFITKLFKDLEGDSIWRVALLVVSSILVGALAIRNMITKKQ